MRDLEAGAASPAALDPASAPARGASTSSRHCSSASQISHTLASKLNDAILQHPTVRAPAATPAIQHSADSPARGARSSPPSAAPSSPTCRSRTPGRAAGSHRRPLAGCSRPHPTSPAVGSSHVHELPPRVDPAERRVDRPRPPAPPPARCRPACSASRSAGYAGSSGTYAPPAFRIASIATTISHASRSTQIATRALRPSLPSFADDAPADSPARSARRSVSRSSPYTTATASGVRSTCSSNSSCTHRSRGYSAAVAFHSTTTCSPLRSGQHVDRGTPPFRRLAPAPRTRFCDRRLHELAHTLGSDRRLHLRRQHEVLPQIVHRHGQRIVRSLFAPQHLDARRSSPSGSFGTRPDEYAVVEQRREERRLRRHLARSLRQRQRRVLVPQQLRQQVVRRSHARHCALRRPRSGAPAAC